MTFGRLTLTSFHSTKNKKTQWVATCECGNSLVVVAANVVKGNTKSCGCLDRETRPLRARIHGQSYTRTFKRWLAMRARCHRNPKYIENGITVCDRWQPRGVGYQNFLADMGECPSDFHTLDRKENAGGYSKENCRWATRLQQNQNASSNINITYDGRTMCAAEWAREIGLPPRTFRRRIEYGWTLEKLMRPKTPNGRFLTWNGKTRHVRGWAKDLGLSTGIIRRRLDEGWSIDRTLSEPRRRRLPHSG